ncbi:MAG: CPBP family intramembrane glutamic endopeptidase [Chlamydiota bacterium]
MYRLILSLLLYSASLGIAAESDELPLDLNHSEEITALDLGSSLQQPAFSEQLELPIPAFDLPRKSSFLAVSLSYLLPGLGHMYLGDINTAGSLMGSTGLSLSLALPGTGASIQLPGIITLQSVWSYGIYAAYRDVRIYNRGTGYSYKMPTDSFADLTFAPFRLSILKKPEVWGGFLGALAIATGTAYLAYPKDAHIRHNLSFKNDLFPLVALPVGIGEESFFRGFLQSQLSETFTPWGGIALSSLAFGAMHIPNAIALEPQHRWRYYTFSLPLITTFGAYFGWLTYKNHSLQESTALHTWYDFVLFAASALATHAAAIDRSGFAIAVPF